MKNRKSLLGLALIIMVLVLGVGYAVVSSVGLTIAGTASTSTEDLAVTFTESTRVSDEDKVTATATNGALSAEIEVTGLTAIGDTETATYTIINNEKDLSAKISEGNIENSKSDYFKVTTSLNGNPVTIAKGETTEVTVTVELIKVPIESTDSTTDITVNLTAEPVQP